VLKASTAFAILIALSPPAVSQSPPRVAAHEAREHRGKVATVCGLVRESGCRELKEIVLRLDRPSGRSSFSIVARAPQGKDIGIAIEDRFDGRHVCATGRIERGKFEGHQIVVASPDVISIEAEPSIRKPLFAPNAHRPCSADAILPKLLREVKPTYTADAMRAKAEGVVLLRAVVEADGRVGAVHVQHSLHPDLDQQAVAAVKQWRFAPGTFQGHPTAMAVAIEMSFRLRG
jgi:TonB family protein